VEFKNLFGITDQTRQLQENIEILLKGKQAQNCILWGARGTGKSSSVFALLQQYGAKGLRLIEIKPQALKHLPRLFGQLKDLKEKFILYVDELGFDAHQSGFKDLKHLLEGGLAQRPENVILIATANRKALVFQEPLDERYPQNKQRIIEERALDDRFGLKIFYPSPKFENLQLLFDFYLQRHGPKQDREEQWLEFRRFAMANGHDEPNGRTLQQYFSQR